jgi:hypothetical protein
MWCVSGSVQAHVTRHTRPRQCLLSAESCCTGLHPHPVCGRVGSSVRLLVAGSKPLSSVDSIIPFPVHMHPAQSLLCYRCEHCACPPPPPYSCPCICILYLACYKPVPFCHPTFPRPLAHPTQRASELVSGAAPRAGLGLQPPLLTLRAHRGVATPLSVGVSSNPRAAALEAVPSVAAGAGHVPLALVGPEIQQEAQR